MEVLTVEYENPPLPVNVGIRLPKGRHILKNMFLGIASIDIQESTLLTIPINAVLIYAAAETPAHMFIFVSLW